jgi:tetratricopeptide (TPR) repeat protein
MCHFARREVARTDLRQRYLRQHDLRRMICWLPCIIALALAACGGPSQGPSDDLDGASLQRAGGAPSLSYEQVHHHIGDAHKKMQQLPAEPYWPYRVGELYAAVDSTARAREYQSLALERDADFTPAVAMLSKLYYEAELYEDAADLLESYLANHPDAPDALRAALALNQEALGEMERATATLRACRNSSQEVRTTMAYVTLRGDDFQAAAKLAKAALDANPASAANHNNYGITLLYAGQPAVARQEFQAALTLEPELPGALYNLAIVETFYFYDQEAGKQWFVRYSQVAKEDPDDLASVFSTELAAARLSSSSSVNQPDPAAKAKE